MVCVGFCVVCVVCVCCIVCGVCVALQSIENQLLSSQYNVLYTILNFGLNSNQ